MNFQYNFILTRKRINGLVNSDSIGDLVRLKVGENLSARVRRVPWVIEWDLKFVKEQIGMIDRLIVTERILNGLF